MKEREKLETYKALFGPGKSSIEKLMLNWEKLERLADEVGFELMSAYECGGEETETKFKSKLGELGVRLCDLRQTMDVLITIADIEETDEYFGYDAEMEEEECPS